MAEAGPSHGGASHERGEQSHRSGVRHQDRFLPIDNITRIMKEANHTDGMIANDAKEFMQILVSEFIGFITGKAADKCVKEKRETITEDDLIYTLETLKFQDYIDRVMATRAVADARAGGNSHNCGQQSPHSNLLEKDQFLPITNITRIMRKAVSKDGKIGKDAKEFMQKCVPNYIRFITSKASDKCKRESKLILNGDDLISAMETLGFQNYVDPLRHYLEKYREEVGRPARAYSKRYRDGTARGGDGSARKDAVGAQSSMDSQPQIAHQNWLMQDLDDENLTQDLDDENLMQDLDYENLMQDAGDETDDWLTQLLDNSQIAGEGSGIPDPFDRQVAGESSGMPDAGDRQVADEDPAMQVQGDRQIAGAFDLGNGQILDEGSSKHDLSSLVFSDDDGWQ